MTKKVKTASKNKAPKTPGFVVSRCAAIVVRDAGLIVCIRTPNPGGGRRTTTFRSEDYSSATVRDWIKTYKVMLIGVEGVDSASKEIFYDLGRLKGVRVIRTQGHIGYEPMTDETYEHRVERFAMDLERGHLIDFSEQDGYAERKWNAALKKQRRKERKQEAKAERATKPSPVEWSPPVGHRPSAEEHEVWIESGRTLWESAGWGRGTSRPFFRYLHNDGRNWALSGDLGISAPARGVDRWLDDILGRAALLGDRVRIANEWPAVFQDRDLTVVIWVSGDELKGWAGNARGVPVRVDVRSWDFWGPPSAQVVVGLVISWFLDCGLSQHDHAHFRRHEIDDSGTLSRATDRFREAVARQRTTTWRPPIAHQVRGHVRSLRSQQPTAWARANAPSYIRRHMGPNDTFVQSHERYGNADTEILLSHLRFGSNLADCIGSLGQ